MPSCKQCSTSFKVTDQDRAFYEKVSPTFAGKKYLVPEPTMCPECRQHRRMTWRNENNLYHRTCDLTGKPIVSVHSSDKPYKVYYFRDWLSDQWDPMEYGQSFDFSRPFFEQFEELLNKVPKMSLHQPGENKNCEYANLCSWNQDCYLIFAALENERCLYSNFLQRNHSVVDCLFIFDSELCYECVDCYHCYDLTYSQNCENCQNASFLFDCRRCRDCFGCVGLVDKQYYIFNKPYSKEEYFEKMKLLKGDRNLLAVAKEKVRQLREQTPRKYYSGFGNENISGDHISYSKNALDCFDCTSLEDSRYCTWMHRSKDCYDCFAWGVTGEKGYENYLCGNGFFDVQFSESCGNNSASLRYCSFCLSSQNLFGCVGLRNKKYCILNKQYSEQEYYELAGRIIEHMSKTGEWGEFFPTRMSPFAYNETSAHHYVPLSKEQVLSRGWKWREEEQVSSPKGDIIEVPESISEVTDEMVGKILVCEASGQPYKITPQELDFYRRMNLPMPRRSPRQRYLDRLELRNPHRLWKRNCSNCQKELQTSYSPDRPEKVYCEGCYLKEVY